MPYCLFTCCSCTAYCTAASQDSQISVILPTPHECFWQFHHRGNRRTVHRSRNSGSTTDPGWHLGTHFFSERTHPFSERLHGFAGPLLDFSRVCSTKCASMTSLYWAVSCDLNCCQGMFGVARAILVRFSVADCFRVSKHATVALSLAFKTTPSRSLPLSHWRNPSTSESLSMLFWQAFPVWFVSEKFVQVAYAPQVSVYRANPAILTLWLTNDNLTLISNTSWYAYN